MNAGSMADISFLLLIFFLVATTMNTDTGINRVLPPIKEDVNESQEKERNILKVFVNDADELMVNSQRMQVAQLKDVVKNFVLNPTNSPSMPEKETTDIEGMGQYAVSKGIVSLQNRRGTSYGMYIAVQNELVKAFNEIRDEVSMEKYGRLFADLPEGNQDAVRTAVPQKISEAEIHDRR